MREGPFESRTSNALLVFGLVAGSVALIRLGYDYPRNDLQGYGFSVFVLVVALLFVLAAVFIAEVGVPVIHHHTSHVVPPMPGVISGVQVVLSAEGVSVLYPDGWRVFGGIAEFQEHSGLPRRDAELELALLKRAEFGVIGTRGAVIGEDGSIEIFQEGEFVLYPSLKDLFADERTADMVPSRQSFFLIDLLGHTYITDSAGELIPAGNRVAHPAGPPEEIISDLEYEPLRRCFQSRKRPGHVFCAIGGRPARVAPDGTVTVIRADAMFHYPSMLDAVDRAHEH